MALDLSSVVRVVIPLCLDQNCRCAHVRVGCSQTHTHTHTHTSVFVLLWNMHSKNATLSWELMCWLNNKSLCHDVDTYSQEAGRKSHSWGVDNNNNKFRKCVYIVSWTVTIYSITEREYTFVVLVLNIGIYATFYFYSSTSQREMYFFTPLVWQLTLILLF